MSGGSFNYLCFKDADELIHHIEELDEMQKRLVELGFDDIASDTGIIRSRIEFFFEWLQKRKEKISDVWHAVEWFDSGDYGEESLNRAIEKYRGITKNGC